MNTQRQRKETSLCGHQSSHLWLTAMLCLVVLANGTTQAQSVNPTHPALCVLIAIAQPDPPEENPQSETTDTVASDSEEPSNVELDNLTGAEQVASSVSLSNTTETAAEAETIAEVETAAEVETVESKEPEAVAELKVQAEVSSENPHPLSVEPTSQMLPKDRPGWIDSDPDFKSPTHQFIVASIPTAVKSELDSNLDATLVAALKNYLSQQMGEDAGPLLEPRLTPAFIRTNFVDETKSYVAEMATGEGPLFQKWVMVEVTPQQREQLKLWHSEQIQRQRVLPLGLGLAGLLTAIGITHFVLKRRGAQTGNRDAAQSKGLNQALESPPMATRCGRFARRYGLMTVVAVGIAVAWLASSESHSSHRDASHRKKVQRKNDLVEIQLRRHSKQRFDSVERWIESFNNEDDDCENDDDPVRVLHL